MLENKLLATVDKKMLAVGLLMLIPGIATFTCYKMYVRDIENGVEGPIKAAAASEDVGVALKEIRGVIKYAEKEGLSSGEMRKWYFKLKKVEARLHAASVSKENRKLESENALLYLKVSLMLGDKVNLPPHQISVYPYGLHYILATLLSVILGIIALFIIMICVSEWWRGL